MIIKIIIKMIIIKMVIIKMVIETLCALGFHKWKLEPLYKGKHWEDNPARVCVHCKDCPAMDR